MQNRLSLARCVVRLAGLAVSLAACNAPQSAARANAAAACAQACTPAPTQEAQVCPAESCLQSVASANPNACAAVNLDPNSVPATGEIRLGQGFLSQEIMGWEPGFCPRVPSPSWAMALAHASRLDQLAGLPLAPAQFLATAIKESTLGCDPAWTPCLPYLPAAVHDGCFQMTCSAGYAQLRQSYGARFAAAPCSSLFGGHVESSALAKAYYDRWAWAVLQARDPNAADFFRQARDPLALTKTLAYAYNQGVYAPGVVALLQDSSTRAACQAMASMTHDGESEGFSPTLCFPNPTGHDYAWAVGRVTAALQTPGRSLYDAQLTWSDVQHYLDRIVVIYPELTCPGVTEAVHARYDAVAAGRSSIGFRYEFGAVLDALLVALPEPEAPSQVVPFAP